MRRSVLLLPLLAVLLIFAMTSTTLADEQVVQGNVEEIERVATFTLEGDGTGLYRNEMEDYAAVAETVIEEWGLWPGWSDLSVWGVDSYSVVDDGVDFTIGFEAGQTRNWGFEYRAVFATETPSGWVFAFSPSGGPYETFIVIVKLPPGATPISVSPTPDETYMEDLRTCYKFIEYDATIISVEISYLFPPGLIPEFGLSTALVTSIALLLYLPIRKRFGKAKP